MSTEFIGTRECLQAFLVPIVPLAQSIQSIHGKSKDNPARLDKDEGTKSRWTHLSPARFFATWGLANLLQIRTPGYSAAGRVDEKLRSFVEWFFVHRPILCAQTSCLTDESNNRGIIYSILFYNIEKYVYNYIYNV